MNFRSTEAGPQGLGQTGYTVRWEGKLLSREAGAYEFEIISDDGVNLWVDGRQLMDEMYPAGRQMNIGEIELQANRPYDIRLEYQQIDRGAEVALTWRTPSMLAVYRPNARVESMPVYLPGSARWTDFWSGEQMAGGKVVEVPSPIDLMPLFVRAGSIVPMGPVMDYANEKPQDPLEIRIFRGAGGRFDLSEDANDGYGYERGEFSVIPFMWDETRATLTIGVREGSFPGMLRDRTFEIILVGKHHGCGVDPGRPDRTVWYTGTKMVLQMGAP